MDFNPHLRFKMATEEWEFEQIHRLNYKTFVEEIPQHDVSPTETLVDKFHRENTYFICLCGDQLLGMIAVRGRRPFSLEQKLEDLDSYLPAGRSICELRLLSIEREHRNSLVLRGLMRLLAQHCKAEGYNLAVISGTTRQLKLYRALGFVPFGPLVGTTDALFQPMYLTLESWEGREKRFLHPSTVSSIPAARASFLPGPVSVSHEVRRAFAAEPVSHRSESFVKDFQWTKQLLCKLASAQHVEILMGSGTLANDAIAAQLSLLPGKGLILSNGEFGERLIDHAARFGLSFALLQMDWDDIFDPDTIARVIARNPEIQWLWAVHCETSTGVLNDMMMLKKLCADRGIKLCMDCISSIGTVPVDLRDVYLASGVSGKGLGAFPGLSMVFYNHKILPAPRAVPRYLDLGLYAAEAGTPFTVSSNLLYALQTALKRFKTEGVFRHIEELAMWLRSTLRRMGFSIVAVDSQAAPAVITIALPSTISSKALGKHLEEAGYFLSYMSEYLLERNWIQICLMGECSQAEMVPLVDALKAWCHLGPGLASTTVSSFMHTRKEGRV